MPPEPDARYIAEESSPGQDRSAAITNSSKTSTPPRPSSKELGMWGACSKHQTAQVWPSWGAYRYAKKSGGLAHDAAECTSCSLRSAGPCAHPFAQTSSNLSHSQDHSGVEALEILRRFLERVHGWRLQFAARRLPFFVLLLAIPFPRTRASPIRGHLEVADLCNALPIHAHLREKVLADGPPH